MHKMVKKAAILAAVATVSTMAIPTSASARWEISGRELDQYEVKAHEQYTLDIFKKFEANTVRNVFVTKVYEKDGILFGTNRTIKWIDTDTGFNGESTLGTWGNTRVYEAGTTFTWIPQGS